LLAGGPVGLAIAIELNRFGVKSVLVEKHLEIQRLPKAQGLNARTMEFMRRWGVADAIKEAQLISDEVPYMRIWCDGFSGAIQKKQAKVAQDGQSPENAVRVPLWKTQKILRDQVEANSNSRLCLGWTVEGMREVSDGIVVYAKKTEGDERIEFDGKYLLACDGANSFVRNELGIEWDEYEKLGAMLSVMFSSHELESQIPFQDKAMLYYFLQRSYKGAFGRIDEGLWYAQINIGDREIQDETQVKNLLYELSGVTFLCDCQDYHPWVMQKGIAKQYQKGRMLLVGDAAHVMSPNGGHGLNTGFGDVINLGWKLAAVLQGWGGESLLATYEQERQPVARNIVHIATQNTKGFDRLQQQSKSQFFASTLKQVTKNYDTADAYIFDYCYAGSDILPEANEDTYPKIGCVLPHFFLDDGSSVYDKLGRVFTLIRMKALQQPVDQALPGFIEQVDLSSQHKLPSWTSTYVLVRPDGHIAWFGGALPDDLELFYSVFIGKKPDRQKRTTVLSSASRAIAR